MLFSLVVDSLDSYLELAKPADPAGFIARCPALFLVKAPSRTNTKPGPDAEISFHTSHAIQVSDPYPNEYRLSPIQKNPQNPFPDRMTLGRAPNCDVVVRMPSVSKVHAHLAFTRKGTLLLKPARTSNLTRHNGRLLDDDSEVEIAPGDNISLGALTLEVMTSKQVYALLREQQHSSGDPKHA